MIAVLRDAGKSGLIRCAMPDRSDCDGGQTLTNPHHNEIGIVLFLGVLLLGALWLGYFTPVGSHM